MHPEETAGALSRRVAGALWRWRKVVAVGALVAAVAGTLAAFDLRGAKLVGRDRPTYEAHAWLLVERVGTSALLIPPELAREATVFGVTGPHTPANLADIYTYFAVSDVIVAQVGAMSGELAGRDELVATRRSGSPESGARGDPRSPVPVVDIAAKSATPERAAELARRTAEAVVGFVHRQQADAGGPPTGRVHVSILREPDPGERVGTEPELNALVAGTAIFIGFLALVPILERRHSVKRSTVAAETPAARAVGRPSRLQLEGSPTP